MAANAGKNTLKQEHDLDMLAQLTAQRDLALALAEATDLEDAMRLCVETAIRVSAMDCGSIYLVDEDSQNLKLAFYSGVSTSFAHATYTLEKNSPIWGMITSGKPIYSAFNELHHSNLPEITAEVVRAVAVIPISSVGKVIASLNIGSHSLDEISISNRLMLETIASQIANSIVRLRAEKALLEGDEIFHKFMDNLPGFAIIHDNQNNVVYTNRRAGTFFGSSTLARMRLEDFMPPELVENIARTNQEALAEGLQVDLINMRDAAGQEHILITYKFPIQPGEKNSVFGNIALDITDRRKAEEKIQIQLEHLASLRTIDHSITSSLNLDVTLDVLAKEVVEQLKVDAVVVLLTDEFSSELKMKNSCGLPGEKAGEICRFLAEGVAKTAVTVRHSQQIQGSILDGTPLGDAGFVDCQAVPLIAKDKVRGALVLLTYKLFSSSGDWLEFLDALSTQAAIAIDNITQYEDLQNVKVTLTDAYDKTIEGWARTLELRDQETANHMQRVVAMTENIANNMGYPEKKMTSLRRGAVLHDIGKIAIPDYIFFKPGALNEAEWRIMRRHPEYARSMMEHIDFLSDSVDIPWAHHEHWDGSGYPRGLIGEAIPLAARIFAVADVWDTLHSDRPYREAWTEEEAITYIKNQSGVQFDPHVVDAFLVIIGRS